MVSEVADEVSLGTEAPVQFVRHVAPFLGAHKLGLLLLLHDKRDKIVRINS